MASLFDKLGSTGLVVIEVCLHDSLALGDVVVDGGVSDLGPPRYLSFAFHAVVLATCTRLGHLPQGNSPENLGSHHRTDSYGRPGMVQLMSQPIQRSDVPAVQTTHQLVFDTLRLDTIECDKPSVLACRDAARHNKLCKPPVWKSRSDLIDLRSRIASQKRGGEWVSWL
jgi:hypothetical protein